MLIFNVHAVNKNLDVRSLHEHCSGAVDRGNLMVETGKSENSRILLDLLNSVESDGGQSQRRLASELGIALGLVNAYLRRCVKKGFLKVTEVPKRRYMYYLTPQGFAEKSRLTVEYLSVSFDFFRRAKAECGVVFTTARERGLPRVALAGISDVAEIAMICALDTGVTVVAIVDERAASTKFIGVPVASSFKAVAETCDAVVITDLQRAVEMSEQASTLFGRDRVFTPNLILPPRRVASEKRT
jgi:DNA-binding MarR family transcriptional regulator